ncbi:MAG: abscisic acid-deficient protein Aba4 family protein [Saprospiraceae bacterium]
MKSLNTLYKISMFIALVGWMILMGFPRADFTDSLVTKVIVLLLCGIYAYLLFFQKTPRGEERYPTGNFKNFQGLVNFFRNPNLAEPVP